MGLDSDDSSTTESTTSKESGQDDEAITQSEDFDPSILYLFKFLRNHVQLRNSHLDFDRLQYDLTSKFTSACVNSGTSLLNLEHYVDAISQQPEDQIIETKEEEKTLEEKPEEEAIFSFGGGGGGFGRLGGGFGGGGFGFGGGATSSALFDTPAEKSVKKTPASFDPTETFRASVQLLSTQIADNPHLLPTYKPLAVDSVENSEKKETSEDSLGLTSPRKLFSENLSYIFEKLRINHSILDPELIR